MSCCTRSGRSSLHASRESLLLSISSSRYGFQSPDVSWLWSGSWSPSRHNELLEDKQEEHSSTNIVEVISWNHNICDLPCAPSESWKICGFRAGID